jgi:hypothetical protein
VSALSSRHQSQLCGWAAGLRAAEAALGRPAPARQPGRRAAAALPRLPHRQPGRGRGTRSGVPIAAHSVQEVRDVLVHLLPPRENGHPGYGLGHGLGGGFIADDTFLLHCRCLLRLLAAMLRLLLDEATFCCLLLCDVALAGLRASEEGLPAQARFGWEQGRGQGAATGAAQLPPLRRALAGGLSTAPALPPRAAAAAVDAAAAAAAPALYTL